MKILTPDQYPGLPKWPAVFITGTSVTPEQAKEINFRTDNNAQYISEYGFGNDRRFRERCQRLFGWQPVIKLQAKTYTPDRDPDAPSPWEISSAWAEEMGMLPTQYVTNDWLASCYIGGPNGWCHPDGTIRVEDKNYGKWPSVEEIVNDWDTLQEAFPFLDLVCTLYSGESCEDHAVPLVSIIVQNGAILVVEADLTLHQGETPQVHDINGSLDHVMSLAFGNYRSERGWPEEWLIEFGARSRAAMDRVLRHYPTLQVPTENAPANAVDFLRQIILNKD